MVSVREKNRWLAEEIIQKYRSVGSPDNSLLVYTQYICGHKVVTVNDVVGLTPNLNTYDASHVVSKIRDVMQCG